MSKYNIIKYTLILFIVLLYFIFDIYYTESTILINKYKPRFYKYIISLDKSSKKLFIIPHLELGDSIALNGAIRYYCSKYDIVIMVCKKSYYKQISFMYKDLNNLIFYSIPDKNIYRKIYYYFPYDKNTKKLFLDYNITYLPMGCFNPDYMPMNDFLSRTYEELNLDPSFAYTYFKINRNYKKEDELYNKLINIIGNKYIIIIDDEKRNFLIDEKYLTNLPYPIFKLSNNSNNKNKKLNTIKDDLIFNYIKILENAHEIISIDSSIPWLIDLLNLNPNTTVHTYTRLDYIKFKNINVINGTLIDKSFALFNYNNLRSSCYVKYMQ
jgi:hypothetical protein